MLCVNITDLHCYSQNLIDPGFEKYEIFDNFETDLLL